jgi:drug/metabolite transporter (DMT)-like permease
MIPLVLSIACSTVIMLVFKNFDRQKTPLFQAVVFNYLVCATIGIFYLLKSDYFENGFAFQPWMYLAIGLGLLFVIVFYLMGYTTAKAGVSTATVAAKMAVVVPVLFSAFYLGEKLSSILIIGIALSLVAVVSVSYKKSSKKGIKAYLIPIFLVFLGSGIIDSSLKYIQYSSGLSDYDMFAPTLLIFASAFVFGSLGLAIQIISKKQAISRKGVIGGITLGIPNFFSIFFLMQALNLDTFKAGLVFPVNNVSIVFLSTLFSVILFKEKLSKTNVAGLLIAGISIFLIAYSHVI